MGRQPKLKVWRTRLWSFPSVAERQALIHTPSCLQRCRCSCGNGVANAEGLLEGTVPPRHGERARNSGTAPASRLERRWRGERLEAGVPAGSGCCVPPGHAGGTRSVSLPCGSRPKDRSDGRMTHRDSAAGVFPIRAVKVSTIRNVTQPECESLIGNIPQMRMRGPRGRCQPSERALGFVCESRRDGSHMRRHQRGRLQSRGLLGHFCQL